MRQNTRTAPERRPRFKPPCRNPVLFDGIGRFDLEGGRIRRYSEVFDRGMALAQQEFAPERLRKIALRYAAALKARPEWEKHL